MSNGFYKPAFDLIAGKMQRNFESGACGGASLLIHHKNEECFYHECGYAKADTKAPVRRDTLFRMFSNTKPITMTAVMQLTERGRLFMEDRLSDFIPEFADMPVAVEAADGTVTYEKQQQPITIHHLCTMTSGLGYGGDGDAGERSIEQLWTEHENEVIGTLDTARMLAKGAALSFQPGTRWKYGLSHDVLGAVIEVVTGQRFGDYLRENIFEPLQMPSTSFEVTKEDMPRFADVLTHADGSYARVPNFDLNEEFHAPRAYQSGGGGLVSTIDDYAHFCQMLVHFGTRGSERILGRKSVEMMRQNQLTPEQTASYSWRDRGYGYALGMRTQLHPWLYQSSFGEFGWDGMLGTWMAVDPAEELTVVYMQNMFPHTTCGMRLMPLIYGALL